MAERSLLDTTLLIEILDYERHTELLENDNSICVVSIYEFIRHKKRSLENKLLLEGSFDVVQLANPVLLKASEIFRKLRENGVTVSENDIYIAAAAFTSGLALYTKDRDFLKIRKYFKELKVNFLSN